MSSSATSSSSGLSAKYPIDPQLSRPKQKKLIGVKQKKKHSTYNNATLHNHASATPVTPLPSAALNLIEPISNPSSQPPANVYSYLVDPNRTIAGIRAQRTVELLLGPSELRPTSAYGRVRLKTAARDRPIQSTHDTNSNSYNSPSSYSALIQSPNRGITSDTRSHSSIDRSKQLHEHHPVLKQFVPIDDEEVSKQLRRSLSKRGLETATVSRDETRSTSISPTRRPPWYSRYEFHCEPVFQFVNLQATSSIIPSGGIQSTNNIQLAFLLKTEGFRHIQFEESNDRDDDQDGHVEYTDRHGQAVRFKKSPQDSHLDGSDSSRIIRTTSITHPHDGASQLTPTVTLTFQTHLPPLFSLVDDAHYLADSSSVCPSRDGLIHAVALQYAKLTDRNRVKVGDIRLLRFALESVLYSLEHITDYMTRMSWTLHYIAVTMKGPVLVFIGTFQDVHIVISASARMGGERQASRMTQMNMTQIGMNDLSLNSHETTKELQATFVSTQAPQAWFMQKTKFYVLHLPTDVTYQAMRHAVDCLQPLPPVLGESVLEMLRLWEGSQDRPKVTRAKTSHPKSSPHSMQQSTDPTSLSMNRPSSSSDSTNPRSPTHRSPSYANSQPMRPTSAQGLNDVRRMSDESSHPRPQSVASQPVETFDFIREDDDPTNGEWDNNQRFDETNEPAIISGRPTTASASTLRSARQPDRYFQQSLLTSQLESPSSEYDQQHSEMRSSPLQTRPQTAGPRMQLHHHQQQNLAAKDEDLHPSAGGITTGVSYISEQLLSQSYFNPSRPSSSNKDAGPSTEEKETQASTSYHPLGNGVYVRVGGAALRSNSISHSGVEDRRLAQLALNSSQANSARRREVTRKSSESITTRQRTPSPVLSFFQSGGIPPHITTTNHGNNSINNPRVRSHRSNDDDTCRHKQNDVTENVYTSMTANTYKSDFIPHPQPQPHPHPPSSSPPTIFIHPDFVHPNAATARPAQSATTNHSSQQLSSLDSNIHASIQPIDISHSQSLMADLADAPMPSTDRHHEMSSTPSPLPASPPLSSQSQPPRPHSAFIRRTSGSGSGVIISGKIMTKRPVSAGVGATSDTNEPTETTGLASSYFGVPPPPPPAQPLPPTPPTSAPSHPKLLQPQEPPSDSFHLESTHASPIVPSAPPLSFASFIGSPDTRTKLPPSAVVQIPAGHPLSYNQPISAAEFEREGIDIMSSNCSLDSCRNKLYAVSGTGGDLYRCVWCRSAVYCSPSCMVEDWMSGHHPRQCIQSQTVARQFAETKGRQLQPHIPSSYQVDQGEGWMEVKPVTTSNSGINSPLLSQRSRSRSRSRSPSRRNSQPNGFHPYDSHLVSPIGLNAYDDAWDLAYSEAFVNESGPYDTYHSYGYPSDVDDSLRHAAAREAESEAAGSDPKSLSAAMRAMSAFPLQPAITLSTRPKSGHRRPTVADMVRRRDSSVGSIMPSDSSTTTPSVVGSSYVAVTAASRSSEAHQLDHQRAYAVLYESLRASDQQRSSSLTSTVNPLARPNSAKLAPPPHTAEPQAPSLYMSRMNVSSSLDTSVAPASVPSRGRRPVGGSVSNRGLRLGGGGSLTPAALTNPNLDAVTVLDPSQSAPIHYVPLGSTTQLFAKTRSRTNIAPSRPKSALSTRSATSSQPSTAVAASPFMKGLAAPKQFAPPELNHFMRMTVSQSSNRSSLSTYPTALSACDHQSRPPPPPPVIPIVDLRRAISAARPTSARLASNGRDAMPK